MLIKALLLATFLYTSVQAGLNSENFSLNSEWTSIAELALNLNSTKGEYFLLPDTISAIKYTGLTETEILDEIDIARRLATSGAIAWCPGGILEIIGFILLGAGNSKVGVPLINTGMIVNLLTPLPSCFSGNVIREIDYQGLYKMIGWPTYICGCTLLGLAGIISAISPPRSSDILEEGTSFSCTVWFYVLMGMSETLRGVAAIMPYVFIRRFERKRETVISIVPKSNFNGDLGLSLILEY